MTRWMLVLLMPFLILPAATASLSPRQRPSVRTDLPAHVVASLHRKSSTASNEDFRLTEKTEVLLDGRPCRYKDVPDGATIILLETATNESKEILKIHFQTTKRRPSPAASK
jgi:hypothetical protein